MLLQASHVGVSSNENEVYVAHPVELSLPDKQIYKHGSNVGDKVFRLVSNGRKVRNTSRETLKRLETRARLEQRTGWKHGNDNICWSHIHKKRKKDKQVFHSPTMILCPLATGLTGTLTYVNSICLQQYMLGSIPSKSNT